VQRGFQAVLMTNLGHTNILDDPEGNPLTCLGENASLNAEFCAFYNDCII